MKESGRLEKVGDEGEWEVATMGLTSEVQKGGKDSLKILRGVIVTYIYPAAR